MANQRIPRDPYRDDPYRATNPTRPIDPTRPDLADDDISRTSRLETDLQADPELGEGPSSGPKIALLAVAIALLLGAVFYGLNRSSVHPNQPSSTAQTSAPATAQNPTAAPPPAGTPANPGGAAKSGTTTGAAPAPTAPAPAAPTGNASAGKQ